MKCLVLLILPAIAVAKPAFRPVHVEFPLDLRALQLDSASNHWSACGNTLVVHPHASPQDSIQLEQDATVTGLVTDMNGYTWFLSGGRLHAYHFTQALPILVDGKNPTLLSRSPDGRAMFYENGTLYGISVAKDKTMEIQPIGTVEGATGFSVDKDGNIHAQTSRGVFRLDAPGDGWQHNWLEVGNLPGSNHDLSGDTLDGKFYMAGGLTAEWGFPIQSKTFDSVLCFDPQKENWTEVGKLLHPRRYNATSHLGDEIWVIGGDNGKGHPPLATVEILNLQTRQTRKGSSIPAPTSMCTAHSINGRIYVLGKDKDSTAPTNFYSIGKGESCWTSEPSAPDVSGPIVSTTDSQNIFVVIPQKHLALYNFASKAWYAVPIPIPPRSCQIAFQKGELWLLGGRGVSGGKATQIYNPKTGKWRQGPNLPRELAWGTAFSLCGNLYVAGGASGSCYSNRTFQLR